MANHPLSGSGGNHVTEDDNDDMNGEWHDNEETC